MKHLVILIAVVGWLVGIVLAAGWWKGLAIFFPLFSWYLVVERVMQLLSLV